ncbi:MAG: CSLREA domain-containing protein [Acidobacteriota bacterium]
MSLMPHPGATRNPMSSLLLATLTVASLGVATAGATTYAVTKTADTADGACDSDCSLREAVIAANAHPGMDVIEIPAGTYTLTRAGRNEQAALRGDLDVSERVTIEGASSETTIIDGNGLDRVIDIQLFVDGVTALRGLTIRGGNVGGYDGGGGVLAYSKAAMTDCVVSGNTSTSGAGGGITAWEALTFDHGAIVGNVMSAPSSPGGQGGGIVCYRGKLTIRHATVSGNRIEALYNGAGGGISCLGCSELEVSDSVVSSNVAENHDAGSPSTGGGIEVGNEAGNIHIARTTIRNNRAAIGGGIWFDPYVETSHLLIEDSTFAGNVAGQAGGAALLACYDGPPGLVRNCTFSGNRAQMGAAVIVPTDYPNRMVFKFCTLTNNTTFQGQEMPIEGHIIASSCIVTGFNPHSSPVVASLGGNLESPGNTFGFDQSSDQVDVPDPGLLPLDWYGGPTKTHALKRQSPAVDAGAPGDCLHFDQRGQPRPSGSNCDSGAYELQQNADTDL